MTREFKRKTSEGALSSILGRWTLKDLNEKYNFQEKIVRANGWATESTGVLHSISKSCTSREKRNKEKRNKE